MTRTILVGEVRTGHRITQIPVSAATWSTPHRDAGEITVTIPLRADDFAELRQTFVGGAYPSGGVWPSPDTYPEPATPVWSAAEGLRPEFLAALEPVRCFLAVVEGDAVLEAGPIWAWDYDDEHALLTVTAKGLASLFDHRVAVAEISSAWAAWAVTFSDLSLATIAKRVVELAGTADGGELPIVLPVDELGDQTRTLHGYDLTSVRGVLDDLMGVEGGPDIAFEPRFTDDRLGIEWVMRTGTTADPLLHQTGDDHVWDSRTPQSGVAGLSVKRDASQQTQRAWMTGDGMEKSLRIARRDPAQIDAPDLRDAGFPLTERVESRAGVSVPETLGAWAASFLRSSLRPWMTWELTVRADASPLLGTYRPGDWVRIWVGKDHPLLGSLLPEGFHRSRIVGISGDLSESVTVTLAPEMEAR